MPTNQPCPSDRTPCTARTDLGMFAPAATLALQTKMQWGGEGGGGGTYSLAAPRLCRASGGKEEKGSPARYTTGIVYPWVSDVCFGAAPASHTRQQSTPRKHRAPAGGRTAPQRTAAQRSASCSAHGCRPVPQRCPLGAECRQPRYPPAPPGLGPRAPPAARKVHLPQRPFLVESSIRKRVHQASRCVGK